MACLAVPAAALIGGDRKPPVRPIDDGHTIDLRMDVNEAQVEELASLPGIGPALAQAIAEYRRRMGPFRSLEDLQQVRGIGPVKARQLASWVQVEGDGQSQLAADDVVGGGHEGGVDR